MSKQSEAVLEEQLILQLQKLGYAFISLKDEASLLNNLKTQLEKHNWSALGECAFSKTEFERVVNILNKGSIFEKAKTLRQK